MNCFLALIAEEILFGDFLRRKRLERKAGIAITEKALTIRSKKQKKAI